MHISEIYKSIYRYYGTTTPLLVDCGELCGGACCESPDEEETGMYLFPGEERIFENNPDFKIVPSEFLYRDNKCANILICKGICNRVIRPLSCRIFPVVPYIRENKFELIFDPRAKSICPLVELPDFTNLDKVFLKKTRNVINLLMKFQETRLFLESLTDIVDDFLKFGL